MTNLKNQLPVAVHVASGGAARVRTGGSSVALEGVSAGSFTVQGASRYKIFPSLRSGGSTLVCIGYASPVTLANASCIRSDMLEAVDDVPDGTTVYFTLVNPMTLEPVQGDAGDYLYVSFYG